MTTLTNSINVRDLATLRAKLSHAIRVMKEVAHTESLNGRLVDMSGFGREPLLHDNHDEDITHGELHVCGVVACAAGWCALDPKAREVFGLPKMRYSEGFKETAKTLMAWLLETPTRPSYIASTDGGSFRFDTGIAFDAALGIDMGRLFGDDDSIHGIRDTLGMPKLDEQDVSADDWVDTASRVRSRMNRMLSRERGNA